MNKDQMEMLSVKSTIERTVQAYESTYRSTGCGDDFLTAVERHMAALFASGQIDRDFTVIRTIRVLEIGFTTHGNRSYITFPIVNFSALQASHAKESLDLIPITPTADIGSASDKLKQAKLNEYLSAADDLRHRLLPVEGSNIPTDTTRAYDYANKFID